MTLAMLGLAGIPATAGFIGKFYLIDAAVSGSYTWLGVVIVIGSMISLGYYLPVIAAMWMRGSEAPAPSAGAGPLPALAGGAPELDENSEAPTGTQFEVVLVAVLAGAAVLVFGIIPQPLFDLVGHAGTALGGLF
jgi:NADH-quinone oxidoreductase subunit N